MSKIIIKIIAENEDGEVLVRRDSLTDSENINFEGAEEDLGKIERYLKNKEQNYGNL